MRVSRGFTLIELLTTISIIGLLSSVIFASLNSSRDKSRIAAGQQLDSTFQRSLGDQRIGAWKLDDCSGTTLQNLESFSYSARLVGSVTWSGDTPYDRGCSLATFGTNAYAQLDNAGSSIYSVQPGTVRSFTTWFKNIGPNGQPGQTIIWKEGACVGWEIVMNTSGTVYGRFAVTSTDCAGVTAASVTSTAKYNDSKWHFAALTIDRINGKLYFYIDGALVGTSSAVDTAIVGPPGSGGTFLLGNNYNFVSYFNGLVDEVYAYSLSLSLSQVQKLYAEGLARHGLASL